MAPDLARPSVCGIARPAEVHPTPLYALDERESRLLAFLEMSLDTRQTSRTQTRPSPRQVQLVIRSTASSAAATRRCYCGFLLPPERVERIF